MQSIINSFANAFHGISIVWKEERNFRIEIFAAVLVSFAILYFHFSWIESALCIIAIGLVLCAEIVNTVIEDVCNKIEPNRDEKIGKIKDMMAGFVLVSVVVALLLGSLAFYHHFFSFFV